MQILIEFKYLKKTKILRNLFVDCSDLKTKIFIEFKMGYSEPTRQVLYDILFAIILQNTLS